jgi:hypothetical protein
MFKNIVFFRGVFGMALFGERGRMVEAAVRRGEV